MPKKKAKVAADIGKLDNRLDKYLISVLLAMLVIIPLIMFPTMVKHISPLIVNNELTGQYDDSVLYPKFLVLVLGSLLLLSVFLWKTKNDHLSIKMNYSLLPLSLMTIFVGLSILFADYKTISILGRFQVREGALTYLCYFIVFFISASLQYTKTNFKVLKWVVYICVGTNGVLTIFNFLGTPIKNIPSTFGNADTVSGIIGVLTVFLITRALTEDEFRSKLTDSLFATLAFATVLCSLSLSGFFTIIVTLPLWAFLFWRSPAKKRFLSTLLIISVMFSLTFVLANSHNQRVWDKSLGFFIGSSNTGAQTVKQAITYDKSPSVAPQDEFYLPPSGWSPGTGRTYIWEKTTKLILARPFFGYGFDTLVYYFPQFDIMKTANLGIADPFVDKPHNMYLNFAFGSGLISLLSFLVLLALHAWYGIRLLMKGISNETGPSFSSLFLAWFAYLVQAIFNDPVISGGIIFWLFFGISTSILINQPKEVKKT